jgi:hypothetical protein
MSFTHKQIQIIQVYNVNVLLQIQIIQVYNVNVLLDNALIVANG